ncbi:hypothetical protein ES703_54593 [subsurface metagenome]
MLDFFIKCKNWIQLLFFLILNSDVFALIRSISLKRALISQSPLKNIFVPGLNCYSCPSAIGSCPIGSLQFWFNDTVQRINFSEKIDLAGFYIIGFLTLTGGICGRLFCGWVCPFGFTQDILNKFTRKNLPIPKIIKSFRYISLFFFVIILPLFIFDITMLSPWFCKLLCPEGTLKAGIPLLLIDENLRQAASVITIIKFFVLAVFLISFFISRRSFCKTLCPLGTIWGFFNRISLLRLKVDKHTCTNCMLCEKKCPMNIKVTEDINSSECIRCAECIKVCPSQSISFQTIFNSEILNV